MKNTITNYKRISIKLLCTYEHYNNHPFLIDYPISIYRNYIFVNRMCEGAIEKFELSIVFFSI